MTEDRPHDDLTGRVAVVTGASGGIGRVSVRRLAARGARVLATGRDRRRLDALRDEVPDIATLVADLADPDAPGAIVAAAERIGPPVILVAAAGLPGHIDRAIWDQEPAAWRATLAVNLDAPFLLSRAMSVHMRLVGWGRIVYVASTAGQAGASEMAAYCASKHGVIGLMRAVACDIGSFGATANAVCPGWVRTDMAEADVRADATRRGLTPAEVWRAHDASYPRGRVLDPQEVGEVISFLISDAASGVNGEAVTVALGGRW
ncbi:MAG: hypothetical protein B7Z10_03395 [Rhodobacterales bacterium 32-66-7]|nr:MAG: hypothetical protein B7Z31_00360 [Rhodobacterales bacterium 12-65-15]OYX26399.1 MAG: hypothetical protein B7Z10_03395 [Rhodobacterales bacterium 32-66-7]